MIRAIYSSFPPSPGKSCQRRRRRRAARWNQGPHFLLSQVLPTCSSLWSPSINCSRLLRKKLECVCVGGRKHRSTKQKKADIQMMLAPHLIEVPVYKRSLSSISYWPGPLVYTGDKSVRFCLITKHMVLLLTTWQNILTTWIMGKAPGRLFWSMWKRGQWEAIRAESLEVTFPRCQDQEQNSTGKAGIKKQTRLLLELILPGLVKLPALPNCKEEILQLLDGWNLSCYLKPLHLSLQS